ncbi:hypothetical protein [Pseudobacteriovorax antillogorgiicola]|uniref:Uncharacterized protein n=1 Tax=Pseudobacteriovorax antillogorgiicola TaxID=1513793 RepID=A0A1Y6C5C4_9BACT|nr:hypothetical protein [Pseudobacteriovorax antillogorgiicola]TCS49892.1 hypothetical protein EDD56_114137 [Pseudobacteriovorax antillogorgiicola]SMF44673.1 hypothetical protein SAMN06296036_113142 [Pseudobacteriovorax antillogorgiicola]
MHSRLLGLIFIVSMVSAGARADIYIDGSETRQEFIRQGMVWEQPNYDISSENLLGSTSHCPAFEPTDVVTCSYIKPKRGDVGSGWTPKFKCRTPEGKKLKVKYGQTNAEVFSEVFSSRLLQLIGFKADCNYPVAKVICTDCPENPFQYTQDYALNQEDINAEFREREFDYVLIEKKFGEETIAQVDGKEIEGWGFDEFLNEGYRHQVEEQNTAREALTLLMAVLQHGDNKRSNQRLYCAIEPDKGEECPEDQKYLVVQDLGATLGSYKFKDKEGSLVNLPPSASFRFWDIAPIWSFWRGAGWSGCTAQVFAVGGTSEPTTLQEQKISEAGRAFLADLMSQITYEQVEQLVAVSKLSQRIADQDIARKMTLVAQDNLGFPWLPRLPFNRNQISSEQWVNTMWKKIQKVQEGSCYR